LAWLFEDVLAIAASVSHERTSGGAPRSANAVACRVAGNMTATAAGVWWKRREARGERRGLEGVMVEGGRRLWLSMGSFMMDSDSTRAEWFGGVCRATEIRCWHANNHSLCTEYKTHSRQVMKG
jgi:hypothetical protein